MLLPALSSIKLKKLKKELKEGKCRIQLFCSSGWFRLKRNRTLGWTVTRIGSIPVSAGHQDSGFWPWSLVRRWSRWQVGLWGKKGHHPKEDWPQARSSRISSLPLAVGDHGFPKSSLEASSVHRAMSWQLADPRVSFSFIKASVMLNPADCVILRVVIALTQLSKSSHQPLYTLLYLKWITNKDLP